MRRHRPVAILAGSAAHWTHTTYTGDKSENMARKPEDNSPAGNAARAAIAAQQREHRRRNRGTTDRADWSTANPDTLLRTICSVVNAGCAIQLGYTRDGGSFVIRIVGDGEPFNEFVRPTEDLELYLKSLELDYAK